MRCGRLREVRPEVPDQVEPGARPAEPVEARRAQHHGDEHQRPTNPVVAGQARERPADDDRAITHRKGGDPCEEPECDGEALPVSRPGVTAVDRHPGERPVRVERHRDRERPRVGLARMRQLEGDESEERPGSGISPPAPRPFEHGSRFSPAPLEQPDRRVRERSPRAEDAPHVPEQDGEERDPQPEDDVDEDWREVEKLDRRPEERSGEGQPEEPHGDRAQHDAHGTRKKHATERPGERATRRVRLEQRPAPEVEQQDERRSEDDGRAHEEVDRGDRQVADDPDPVGDQAHGWTVMSAI